MEPAELAEHTVSYQFKRDVLIKLLFWRMALHPRRLRSMAKFSVVAVVLYFVNHLANAFMLPDPFMTTQNTNRTDQRAQDMRQKGQDFIDNSSQKEENSSSDSQP